MSFDLAVWKDDDARFSMSNAEATERYRLLRDDVCGGGLEMPGITEFYNELTARYPEIDVVPEEDVDDCPWTVQLCRSGHHVIMSIVWSRAEEIQAFVLELVKQYNLTLFDPQKGRIVWPLPEAKKRWFRFS